MLELIIGMVILMLMGVPLPTILILLLIWFAISRGGDLITILAVVLVVALLAGGAGGIYL